MKIKVKLGRAEIAPIIRRHEMGPVGTRVEKDRKKTQHSRKVKHKGRAFI